MMNERGKSDPAVVAAKVANKAERSVAEPVEPRAGTKGNANQQHTGRTQSRETVAQRWRAYVKLQIAICRHSPEVGAVCGKAARTDLCGGRGAISVPTATVAVSYPGRRLSGDKLPTCAEPRQRDVTRKIVRCRAENSSPSIRGEQNSHVL